MQILTGVDIVDCGRIKKILDKYEHQFLSRYFTKNERESLLAYSKNKTHLIQSVAARFAAKEALSKALGVGLMGRSGIRLIDVEIIKRTSGKPTFVLYETAKRQYERLGIISMDLSYSHLPAYAVAHVSCITN